MPSRLSITTARSSSQPLCAAALIIRYSPLTWYAATGNWVCSRTARTTSRYGPAGLTITRSAPSSSSASISRSASRTLAGSIWYVDLSAGTS